MGRALHAGLPEIPAEPPQHRWDLPVPLDDIATALMDGGGDLTLSDIDEVTEFDVSYHGAKWTLGDDGGTEFGLVLLARLKDGRWVGVEAWNDYTGWGCQDGSDVYIGATREDVIANGLTNDGRSSLGLAAVQ